LETEGHETICCARDIHRFYCPKEFDNSVKVIEVDFKKKDTLCNIPNDIDAAYYLMHSMSGPVTNFDVLESTSAHNFVELINNTNAKQVIYLSGIVNEKTLSKHLSSRKAVEEVLNTGNFTTTTLCIIFNKWRHGFKFLNPSIFVWCINGIR
jgi:uncharacterized protein YbjT (DUF2867 family)